ncbi:helix-turn-helix domain-containing protein [Nocardioides sp.]|uniref:helix-turn-helix domain-containing protein n=1 Tax=Nocardioides sp. TaxID=35761 RepID=UPI0039C91DD2
MELARAIGLTQRAFSRRYRGDIEWSVNELSSLAQALGLTFAELTEHTPLVAVGPTPTPGGDDRYAIRDSNPEPAD